MASFLFPHHITLVRPWRHRDTGNLKALRSGERREEWCSGVATWPTSESSLIGLWDHDSNFLPVIARRLSFLTDFQAFSIVCPFAGNFKNYFTFVYNTAPWYDLLLQKFCTDCTIVFLAMLAFSTVKVRVHLSTPEL